MATVLKCLTEFTALGHYMPGDVIPQNDFIAWDKAVEGTLARRLTNGFVAWTSENEPTVEFQAPAEPSRKGKAPSADTP